MWRKVEDLKQEAWAQSCDFLHGFHAGGGLGLWAELEGGLLDEIVEASKVHLSASSVLFSTLITVLAPLKRGGPG